jgi:hypothetical protein
MGSDVDTGSSEATSSSESSDDSDDDPDLITPAEIYVRHMANLYSECYMAERTHIQKSQKLMNL